ncbi:PDZ domain-containing protein [Parerythrobacter aurantius]|uniref:PDZ domain-containing protein n=1 Tax=Parerythrobacter aurantius TaxID=3127706 RepID=UPI00324A5CE8
MKRLLAAALIVTTFQVPIMANATADETAESEDRAIIGLGFWLADDGIEISDVTKGSAAERAGLKVGMLITQINGKALAEMEIAEVEQMVASLECEIVLKVRELGEVKLHKAVIERNAG